MIHNSHNKQKQSIARCEYGLHAAIAEPFRTDDGSFGITYSTSGQQSRTAALKKQNCTNNPIKGGKDVRYV